MAYQNILWEKREEIGILTINRPEVRNALSQETLLEIDGPCMGQKKMRGCGWSSSPAQGTRPSAPGPASTRYARFRCWTIGDAGGPGFSGKEEAGL
jgi:hypothetical protein